MVTRIHNAVESLACEHDACPRHVHVTSQLFWSDDVEGMPREDLEAKPASSLPHYRIGECVLKLRDLQAAANELREALN